MKKTLIALAAVAATGAAFAQSSVTLYGVADAAIVKMDGQSTILQSASSGMNNGTSRWGVRGSEDLGGGLKAGFTFEQGLSLANGDIQKSGTGEFGRAAWMNLSGGFGDLRIGRSLTPAFYTMATWELTGTANYSVQTKQFGAVFGGSRANGFIYTTPSMSGFKAQVGYALKDNNGGAARSDLSLTYANGPLAASFNYNKSTGGEKNIDLGARYTMGMFTLAGAIIDPAGDSKGFALGGTVNTGPVALTLDIARDTNAKDTDFLLEAKYPMSKRTMAYFAFQRDGKGKTAANANNVGLGIRHNF